MSRRRTTRSTGSRQERRDTPRDKARRDKDDAAERYEAALDALHNARTREEHAQANARVHDAETGVSYARRHRWW